MWDRSVVRTHFDPPGSRPWPYMVRGSDPIIIRVVRIAIMCSCGAGHSNHNPNPNLHHKFEHLVVYIAITHLACCSGSSPGESTAPVLGLYYDGQGVMALVTGLLPRVKISPLGCCPRRCTPRPLYHAWSVNPACCWNLPEAEPWSGPLQDG